MGCVDVSSCPFFFFFKFKFFRVFCLALNTIFLALLWNSLPNQWLESLSLFGFHNILFQHHCGNVPVPSCHITGHLGEAERLCSSIYLKKGCYLYDFSHKVVRVLGLLISIDECYTLHMAPASVLWFVHASALMVLRSAAKVSRACFSDTCHL